MSKACHKGGTTTQFTGDEHKHEGYNHGGNYRLTRNRSLCNSICVVQDNKALHLTSTWCASGLNSGSPDAIASLTAYDYFKVGQGDHLSNEEKVLFFDWLCNRSPYAVCISTKSAKFAAKEGIILDASYPNNLVVGAIIASRICWEYRNVCRTMQRFVEKGMNESAAFFLAHYYKVSSTYGITKSGSDGHCALTHEYTNEETLVNFVKGTQVYAGEPLSAGYGYGGIHTLWGGKTGMGSVDILTIASRDHINNLPAAPNPIPNPFAKSLQLGEVVSLPTKQAMEVLVAYVNKLIGE